MKPSSLLPYLPGWVDVLRALYRSVFVLFDGPVVLRYLAKQNTILRTEDFPDKPSRRKSYWIFATTFTPSNYTQNQFCIIKFVFSIDVNLSEAEKSIKLSGASALCDGQGASISPRYSSAEAVENT